MIDLAVKLSGSVAVVLASMFYGYTKICDVRRGITELGALLELVRYIGDNIEHFMKPLPDIVGSFRSECLAECGFLECAIERGLYDAWISSDFRLNDDATELLDNFFSSVGNGYADDEKKLCGYTEKRLTALLESSAAAAKDKERIYKTIPPMLAASVVLILI